MSACWLLRRLKSHLVIYGGRSSDNCLLGHGAISHHTTYPFSWLTQALGQTPGPRKTLLVPGKPPAWAQGWHCFGNIQNASLGQTPGRREPGPRAGAEATVCTLKVSQATPLPTPGPRVEILWGRR